MSYLLLILFPFAMAASSFVLRKHVMLTTAIGVSTACILIGLVTQLPIDQPTRLLGLTLVLDALSRLFLIGFLTVGLIASLVTRQIQHGENFIPVALLILGLTGATLLLLQEPFMVSLLLVSAGVLAVLAIVDLPTGSPGLVGRQVIATALKYLVLMVVAGVMMYMAFVLANIYQPGEAPGRVSPAHLILALMAAGFGLRLAVTPFHSWLPDLAENAAPMVSALVITVINITCLIFLINSFQFYPIIVLENERGMSMLMIMGALTAVVGAVLALGQESMRRVIGYLIVYDAGMALFGLATTTTSGLAGSLFCAFNQLLAVLLLFVSISLLERPDGRPGNVLRHDLLWRWPVAGSGLLGGGLALLGLPPFSGFAGKLLVYEAAAQRGGIYLAVLLVASGVALLALTRLARERLFGAAELQQNEERPILLGTTELDRPHERRLEPEPRPLALLTIVLLAICLALGLYPQPLLATIYEVIRNLTFVQAL